MEESPLNGVENTVGKGEIARNEQFLPFGQCFQDWYCGYVRTSLACLGKSYICTKRQMFRMVQIESFSRRQT